MTIRKPLIAGNWKMNMLVADAVALAEDIKARIGQIETVDVAVCPTFTALYAVGKTLQGSRIQLGAQDAYVHEKGAYTGEISPQMLLDVGCTWTIIGHSERRHILGESDELLNEKLKFALSSGLNVMFCVGELLEEREKENTENVIERQLVNGLAGVTAADLDSVVIAYEPVWAIGTGLTASPDQAEEVHVFIRGLISKSFGEEAAAKLRIQYGGSVKPDNAAELFEKENIDGFLVGGKALIGQDFAEIVKSCG